MDNAACRNPQTCGTELAQILRAIHPFHTAKLIGRDTGVPARTVERWLDGTSSPSLAHFALLVAAHPAAIQALLPAAPWLEAALLMLEQSRLDAAVAAMPARRERAIAALRGRR